jgi:hypothetical protein
MGNLSTIIGRKGQFILMVGSKDVGKSLILQSLENQLTTQQTHMVVTVSGRYDGANLTMALFQAMAIYAQRYSVGLSKLQAALAPVLNRVVTAMGKVGDLQAPGAALLFEGLGSMVEALLTPDEKRALTIKAVLDLYEKMASNVWAGQRIPTIFIDEVNLMLKDQPAERAEDTKAILDRLTRDTKEKGLLNIVLATSEHSEPYRLRKLGFGPEHFTRTIFVGEIPPSEMGKLLTGVWGMGPHLATACMSVYGGHIWRTYNALLSLVTYRNAFAAFDGYVPQVFSNVEACLNAQIARGGDMKPLLEDLCVKGYAATRGSDPRAEVVSQNNVGALLRASTTIGVLPGETRAAEDCWVLPSSQYIRLVLARALLRNQPKTSPTPQLGMRQDDNWRRWAPKISWKSRLRKSNYVGISDFMSALTLQQNSFEIRWNSDLGICSASLDFQSSVVISSPECKHLPNAAESADFMWIPLDFQVSVRLLSNRPAY